jgi:hypothetical protein
MIPYYEDGGEDEYRILLFPKEWVGSHLPIGPENRSDYDIIPRSFVVTLLDTESGKTYPARTWPFYEPTYGGQEFTTVQVYMFRHHYCPCHRKSDAEAMGCEDTDDECEGTRFLVQSVVAEQMPDVVLYSETLSVKELEDSLKKHNA